MENDFFNKIQAIFGHSVDDYKEYINTNMTEIKKFINSQRRKNSAEFDSHFTEEEYIFDLGMYLIVDLALSFSDSQYIDLKKDNQKVLKFTEPTMFSDRLKFSFRNFLYTLFNTLLSIKILLKHGLNHQAAILTRYYIETTELIIALMYDDELYEIYMQDCEDENEFKKWKQYFTPEKIRKIIDEYENTVDKKFNLYDFRKRVYKNLSQTAHNSCLDLNLGCFGVDFNNEEYLRYNIAGVISKDMKQTINPVIYSTGIFLLYITTILCDLRKMKFYVNKKDGDVPYLVALEIYKELFYDYALKNAKI